jgi:hypothetical protein
MEASSPVILSDLQAVIRFNISFLEELMTYFPSIKHGSHRKRRLKLFFYCCMCILCRGSVSTEPLPSNERGIYIWTHRLTGGIYEVGH